VTLSAARGPGSAGDPATLRVLLVDDHPVVREGVRAMLAPEPDIEVAGEAGSGDEAVAQARSGSFDVILMDLRMPGTDGVAAIGQIRDRRGHLAGGGGRCRRVPAQGRAPR